MSEEWFRGRGWTYGPQKNTVTEKYAEAAVKVAKEMHLPSVNLWSAIETRVQASRKNKLQALSANLETGNSTILTDSEESTAEKEDPSSEYDGYDEFLKDGLHLNSKGNKLLFRLLSTTIERTWPELRP
ncbi:hypothetical protein EV175_007264 [Coemansia sp. RSA 1933]|nr:hypothetical protein EV175_007264 [Coemansia sp. RSA 1933]